ncbi:MAG: hypothetical protein ACRD0S_06215 [Acidimicrobiales bacterium]
MNILKLCRNQWDRTLAIVLVLGGFVALGIGWLAVSDTVFTFEQIPYVISGGLLGVCLIALGCAAWTSADLRDEWRKLDRLEVAVESLVSSPSVGQAVVLTDAADSATNSRPRAVKVSGAV